jgi:hypothetical protein
MACPYHVRPHLGGTLDGIVEIVDLKPQEDAIAVRLVFAIANRSVRVVALEAMQLQNEPSLRLESLVLRTTVRTPAAEKSLIPSATGFHVGYRDKRLRSHSDLRLISPRCDEVVSIGVEKEFGSFSLLGDDDLFLLQFGLHSLFQLNSSNNAFASCRSFVSNPSVN